MKCNLTTEIEQLICKDYQNLNLGTEALATKYHVGKKKIREILEQNSIPRKSRGKQPLKDEFVVSDWHILKYPPIEGKHYIVIDEKTGFSSRDIDNKGGHLTSYIEKEYGISTPTIYDRRLYYMRTGNYWWEQWLKVEVVNNPQLKVCPYCGWSTKDINNLSGWFEIHLKQAHDITRNEYLKEYPDDIEYFYYANPLRQLCEFETDENKFIRCAICGEKRVHISLAHLRTHGITREEYIAKYGPENMVSKDYHDRLSKIATVTNMSMPISNLSVAETEIHDYITSLGLEVKRDRTILKGQELDIFIPNLNVAVEYDGLYWHNELYKDKDYHLKKTEKCLENGVHLIHIFEDEWRDKRDVVKSILRNALNKTRFTLFARKCTLKEVNTKDARQFLEENHLQGGVNSKYRYGLYYDGELVSLMTFGSHRKALGRDTEEGEYELLRFCNKLNMRIIGGASRLFKHFIKIVNPKSVISYADRRWSVGGLYEKLGFTHDHDSQPGYYYVIQGKRINRFNLRKSVLVEKCNCPPDMSEHEFCKSKKWYRIYDCGAACYIWEAK